MSSKKKKSLKDICQNILMVCGVITALTGALGGVVDTFGGGDKKGGEGSGGGGGEPKTIIIEQRVSVPSGETKAAKLRVSKTADVSIDEGGEDPAASAGAAASAVSEGESIPEMPVTGSAMSMSAAPEKSLMGMVSGLWGWMLGGGLGVMLSIIALGWWVKRQTKPDETK
jgi:hypothetical protein